MKLAIGYYICMNLLGFIVMKIDKGRAKKHAYRISEKTLWMIALCFGALGLTIGMNKFRHKTKHWYFKYGFPLLTVIEIVLFFYILIFLLG
ncbi:DUF1294 domain-containing protein [Bacillaceae bacterium Marseille-Q3522]|nr:DUF1294 domain-containing protein [Bacillaceae bacterium Marseille-Q3522]